MGKRGLAITGVLLALLCFGVIVWKGSTYTFRRPLPLDSPVAETYDVEFDPEGIASVTDLHVEDRTVVITVRAEAKGKTFLYVADPNGGVAGFSYLEAIYVHPLGVMTVDNYFGRSTGGAILSWAAALYLALLLASVIRQYRRDLRRSLYRYKNVRNLGWIIFLAGMLLGQLPRLLSGSSLLETVQDVMSNASTFAYFAFPVAFVVSVLVTISNVKLVRREGRSWRNLLGVILGVAVLLGTVFPHALSEYLQRSTVIDVHNQAGVAMHVEMLVTNTILVIVSYLECVLAATIVLSLKAARAVPDFDRDCILILGCQIRKDGSLTPLLQGRADRALEFARLQREATGKALLFVPSGGQGADEVLPEGEAIRSYLLGSGVPDGQILAETRSKNTDENFRCSMELLRKRFGDAPLKIAFATTNYHVFRSGILAAQQGVDAQGIGGKTHSYFWINAFIREFIATMVSERKKHLRVIAALVAAILLMVGMVFLSNRM